MPIRVFYFDGTQGDLERDVGIFLELARTYQRKKSQAAHVPGVLPAGSEAAPASAGRRDKGEAPGPLLRVGAAGRGPRHAGRAAGGRGPPHRRESQW